MRVIDLSHPIRPDMPVYPGTEPPKVALACTHEEHGFEERLLTMYSHTGTHVDAPAHILPGAPGLDGLGVERFAAPAAVLDVRGLASGTRPTLGPRALEPLLPALAGCRWAVLRTGWEAHWGAPGYYEGFPVLTAQAARLLAGLGLWGVGVDAISVDHADTEDYPVHKVLFAAGMAVAENLRNLGAVMDAVGDAAGPDRFTLVCAPLRIAGGEGSPVRALALVD